MSDWIGHECGIATVRLLKPLEYYIEKYGSPMWALNKFYMMLEKQRNRGQDGVGAAVLKLDMEPGNPYIARSRSVEKDPTVHVYKHMCSHFERVIQENPEKVHDAAFLKEHIPFFGEIMLGHLRYGTHGKGGVSYCHPFLRQNNWKTRNLMVAGNFNLTNNDELFDRLVELGQHPRERADTVTVMEKIGHFLDEANDRLFRKYRAEGISRQAVSERISKELDVAAILRAATHQFDGGYVFCGIIGNGDMFVMRDPNAIRPAFYYQDDEVLVVASERPAIQTAFDTKTSLIKEIPAGHALITKSDGTISIEQILKSKKETKCSFERIYFSRGTDRDIYNERKELGKKLCAQILKQIDYDFEHTVFSFIPNTAECAFLGLMDEMRASFCRFIKHKVLNSPNVTEEELDKWLSSPPRMDKILTKDAKVRTFISTDKGRDDLVALAYDTTYGVVKCNQDTLVVLDDSIVRGTTLKQSILRILDRIQPKKIIVVSSAPQIRYPDCYGIDMSQVHRFCAFTAAVEIRKERGEAELLQDIYEACKKNLSEPRKAADNKVKMLYAGLSDDEISAKISEMVTPDGINAEIEVLYQTVEDLHAAIPEHTGDWYFTGDYPTPGGHRVANRAFVNFMEGKDERAY